MDIVVFNQQDVNPAQLIVEPPEKVANVLTRSKSGETTRSQLRRFYQEWVMLRNRTRFQGYKKCEVAIKMLIAKAAYASGRQNAAIPKEFVDWLQENLKQIRNADDVETFGNYFEAMVGYFYGAQAKGSGGRR